MRNTFIDLTSKSKKNSEFNITTLPFQSSNQNSSRTSTPMTKVKSRNSLLPSLTHRKSKSTSNFMTSRIKHVEQIYEAVASQKNVFKILSEFSEKEYENDLEASFVVRNANKFVGIIEKRMKKIDEVIDEYVVKSLEEEKSLLKDSVLLVLSQLYTLLQKTLNFISEGKPNSISNNRQTKPDYSTSNSKSTLNTYLELLLNSYDPRISEIHRSQIADTLNEGYQREKLRILVKDTSNEKELIEKAEDFIIEYHKQREDFKFQLSSCEKKLADLQEFYKDSIVISSEESKRIFSLERTTISNSVESKEFLSKLDNYYKGIVEEANKKGLRFKAQYEDMKEALVKEKANSLALSNKLRPKIIESRFTQTGMMASIENIQKSIEISFLLPKDLVLALTSMLTSNKILDDFQRKKEKVPILNFKEFAQKCFYLTFGNSTISRILERDFNISIKEYLSVNERIGNFGMLMGIGFEDQVFETDYDYFKKNFLSSPLASKFYCSIAFEVRKISKSDVFSTFLSNLCNGSEERLYNKTEITNLIHKLAILHNLEEGKDELVKRAEIAMMTKKNLSGETGNLRLDEIIKTFLNALSDHFCRDLERLSAAIKLTSSNRKKKDYFSEDILNNLSRMYEGKKPKFWIENLFVKMIAESEDGVGIPEVFTNIMDLFFEDKLLNEFYVRKEEKGEKGNNIEGEYISTDLNLKIYDYSSSLASIQESYDMFLPAIKKEEALNDNLYIIHEAFKKELNRMPRKVLYVKKIDQFFLAFSQNELMYTIENLWKLFRSIMDQVFSRV